jgi:hypothetical protein
MKMAAALLALSVSCLPLLPAAPPTDALTESLQRGLLEEEVNRDLNAAVRVYESAVAQTEAQRPAAATAVFRLAETYRKLGRTNDAVAQYRRLLDQFADQAPLAGLSRTNLQLLGPAIGVQDLASPVGVAPNAPSGAAEARLLGARLARIKELKADPEQQAYAVQAFFPDEGLKRMLWHLPKLRAQAAFARTNESVITISLRAAVGPDGSALVGDTLDLRPGEPAPYLEEQLATQLSWITERVDFILKSQQARLLVLQAEVERPPAPTVTPVAADPADAESVREEIKLVEQELKSEQVKLANGKADAASVRKVQRELLRLQRQLPENAGRARQVALAQQALKLTEENLEEIRRKIEVGAAPPLDEISARRELLGLQRELGAAQRLPQAGAVAPAGSASAQLPRVGVARVVGEVKRPGTVPLDHSSRKDIIDAITESGGLTENARTEIEFTRDGQTRKFYWDQLKAEADPENKIWLQPGDTIEVKRRLL